MIDETSTAAEDLQCMRRALVKLNEVMEAISRDLLELDDPINRRHIPLPLLKQLEDNAGLIFSTAYIAQTVHPDRFRDPLTEYVTELRQSNEGKIREALSHD